MEATVFTGWIYDYLLPHAAALKGGKLKKKKKFLASTAIRERRRTLRYRTSSGCSHRLVSRLAGEHKLNLLGSPEKVRQQMEVWF